MKPLYEIGQRLEFIARHKCTVDEKIIEGKWAHYVGYVKQVRRSLLAVRYVMILPKANDIFIVPQRDIIGIVEKRDNTNKPNTTYRNDNV